MRIFTAWCLYLKLLVRPLQELDFFRMFLFLDLASLCFSFLDGFAFRLQLVHCSFELVLFVVEVRYLRKGECHVTRIV